MKGKGNRVTIKKWEIVFGIVMLARLILRLKLNSEQYENSFEGESQVFFSKIP